MKLAPGLADFRFGETSYISTSTMTIQIPFLGVLSLKEHETLFNIERNLWKNYDRQFE